MCRGAYLQHRLTDDAIHIRQVIVSACYRATAVLNREGRNDLSFALEMRESLRHGVDLPLGSARLIARGKPMAIHMRKPVAIEGLVANPVTLEGAYIR